MGAIAEKIRNEASALSLAERAELAHFLIRSLEPNPNDLASDLEAEWELEFEKRREEIQNGAAVGIPAGQVFEEIRARLQRGDL